MPKFHIEKWPGLPHTWPEIWHPQSKVARMIWNSWGDINIRCSITCKSNKCKSCLSMQLVSNVLLGAVEQQAKMVVLWYTRMQGHHLWPSTSPPGVLAYTATARLTGSVWLPCWQHCLDLLTWLWKSLEESRVAIEMCGTSGRILKWGWFSIKQMKPPDNGRVQGGGQKGGCMKR